MSPKSGHFILTCKLILLDLPTLKPYNLYCNCQVESIVKRSGEGRYFRSIQLSCTSMLQVKEKERKLQTP